MESLFAVTLLLFYLRAYTALTGLHTVDGIASSSDYTWKCMKNDASIFTGIYRMHAEQYVDVVAINQLRDAVDAGFSNVDVLLVTDGAAITYKTSQAARIANATAQPDIALNAMALRGICKLSHVWIAFINDSAAASRLAFAHTNWRGRNFISPKFLEDMLTQVFRISKGWKDRAGCTGFQVGIFTNQKSWSLIGANTDNFVERFRANHNGSSLDLWYDDGTDDASFSSYAKIGGWDKPTRKLLGMSDLCGRKVMRSFENAANVPSMSSLLQLLPTLLLAAVLNNAS